MFNFLFKKNVYYKFNLLKEGVLNLKNKYSLLTDSELRSSFDSFRKKITKIENIEDKLKFLSNILVEVYALVKEVIFRFTKLTLYDSQILAGIAIHFGNIAQLNTGEGKTLSAFLPICLNALVGKQIFVVTANEYLAERDWKLAYPILDFLGISSGVNLSFLSLKQKQVLYNKNLIIYSTSNQIAFDYLKKNLIKNKQDDIKSEYFFAIIDEIDYILLDESQNPLIISNSCESIKNIDIIKIEEEEYQKSSELSKKLKKNIDYVVDEKKYSVYLTKNGIKKVEKYFKIDNLLDFKNNHIHNLIRNSFKAYYFYKKDVDYIVDNKNDRIVLIDQLTGRLVDNRKYNDGLQQAIEVLSGVKISERNINTATVTYQNFFRLFYKLSGMTGTAEEDEEEFIENYNLSVFKINPNKKVIRKDLPDKIFFTKEEKYKYVINLVEKISKDNKQPILIGSPSVLISEQISNLLWEKGIFHYKLNAINHNEESEIISKGGKLGSVIISTNMAGRGTDIVLSEESKKSGGLFVIGLEDDFTKRSRLQLIGRAGRQGDPGKSCFFVSLEDKIIRNYFENSQMMFFINFLESLNKYSKTLSSKVFDILISDPQDYLRINSSIHRKSSLSYDLLIDKYRRKIYNIRKKVIYSNKINDKVREKIIEEIDGFWSEFLEFVEKKQRLISFRIYSPQNPKEAFFKTVNNSFDKSWYLLQKALIKVINKK